MSESFLSFSSTATFRNSLMARNLAPYNIPGAYTPPAGNTNYEISPLQDSSVIDSPNNLISTNQLANGLYPLNEYGPEGGFSGKYSVPGQPLPVDSNQGPYNPQDPNFQTIDLVNEFFIDAAYIQNKYGPEGGFNDLITITDIQLSEQYFQSYDEPFVNSLYKPYQILVSQNPIGSDGTLSQDTFLAKIAATNLKTAFQERIAYEVTFLNAQGPSVPLGFGNLNTLNSPFSNLFTNFNNQPLTNKDWKISVPEDTQATNQQFTNRIQENYYPSSPIPGEYFDTFSPIQVPAAENVLENINNITGNLGPVLNIIRNPSEIFIANTGKAQQSVLFNSLDYNTYRPSYNRGNISDNIQNAIANFLDNDPQITGKYYVGSAFSEPSLITSPPNQVAVNSFGKQQNTIVYGPSELGILYEGNEQKLNFGLKGKSITDGGGIMGEFIWTSPKYQANAGFKVKPGGDPGKKDDEFNVVESQYGRDRSSDFTFKQGSILDDTQRIIEAADRVTGKSRLKHVGNAINQVSKVFNDGYKELTKGSQVIAYYDSSSDSQTIGIEGTEVGREYCRIFQKDTPYYTFRDLQKTDGITTTGRKFTNSVLDNTYNLNIAPIRGEGSTNIRDGRVKKYMFSLENLAWRTSDKPGFTIQDLPECERGPNGGRIMWFPPYDLTFSEDTRANWNPTKFLGRPEPIYTYQDSQRTGTISWKIVVDNPSALNTIIEKQLAQKSDEEVNSIVDSFFAGCVKYDLYDLAAKYNQIPISELYTYQEILNDGRTTPEEKVLIQKQISKLDEKPKEGSDGILNENKIKVEPLIEKETKSYRLHFDNTIPLASDDPPGSYTSYYNQYLAKSTTINANAVSETNNGTTYNKQTVSEFFKTGIVEAKNDMENFLTECGKVLVEGGTVELDFVASTDAKGGGIGEYNTKLSQRRYNSVKKWIFEKQVTENKTFADYFAEQKFVIPNNVKAVGPDIDIDFNGKKINCRDTNTIYGTPSMVCRSVLITGATITRIQKDPVVTTTTTQQINNNVIITPIKPKKRPDPVQKLKDSISKKILRNLFSECDYFEGIKEENPMIYQSFKEKIKYFSPAFHSMTPEGLNSRLTFLNQCLRPGQTIPVIGNDNQLKYNDALNTSFGTPPVLVLRIGDFYHTKIIPNNLQIGFDPLIYDINPEGIGVQPMIAKISLSFDFIGGQGLAGPIKQLQNALSFNYYGNTEIYDDRSIATESTKERDEKLEKILVGNQTPVVTDNDIQNEQPQKGLTPIGVIKTSAIDTTTGFETGEIDYYNLMKELQDNSKNYFNAVINQSKSMTETTNWGISQLVYKTRNYIDGVIDEYDSKQDCKIYGKPDDIAKKIENLIDNCNKDVRNDQNPIIKKITDSFQGLPEKVLRNLKETFQKVLKTNRIDLNTLVQQQINTIVESEQNLNYTLRKMDTICYYLDGVKLATGDLKVYTLTGTPENSLIIDIEKTYRENLGIDLNIFLNPTLTKNKILSEEFYDDKETIYYPQFGLDTKLKTNYETRFYMGMCNIFLNKNNYNTFLNSLIDDEVKKTIGLETVITNSCNEFQQKCEFDHNLELKIYKDFEQNSDYKKFSEYKLTFTIGDQTNQTIEYFNGKTYGYTTEKIGNFNDKKKIIKDLYSNKNLNENKKTFNGKVTFN